jgi:hypothetical protein
MYYDPSGYSKINCLKDGFNRILNKVTGKSDINHPVLDNIRVGSALKDDPVKSINIIDPVTGKTKVVEFRATAKSHGFNDIIDNFAINAKRFDAKSGDKKARDLYQILGTYNGRRGVFEWIVEPGVGVTHRSFIRGVGVTGKSNMRP